MKEIQVAGVERHNPYKRHDRTVVAERERSLSVGVFDGAGDPLASSRAAKIFKKHSSRRRPPTLTETFRAIQQSTRHQHPYFVARAVIWNADHRDQGDNVCKAVNKTLDLRDCVGRTTGTAARLSDAEGPTVMDYTHAGDSSLHLFDHVAGQRLKITEDEDSPSNFLGSKSHELQQIGRLVLPELATIALISDGINCPLDEILAGEPDVRRKAAALVDASSISDDASAIVIEYHR